MLKLVFLFAVELYILNTDLNNDYVSSQQDKRITDVQQDHCIASESTLISPLVLKIRPDSLTLTTTNSSNGIPSIVESESNRQLLIKLKKNENGELLTRKNSFGSQMSTEYLINEQQNCSTANELASTILTNGHTDSLYKPVTIQSSPTPHVTNMLLNFNNDDNKQKSQQKPVL
ncbi:unnamed protein product, partial [Rotaria magnacalcarata]